MKQKKERKKERKKKERKKVNIELVRQRKKVIKYGNKK